MKCKYCNDTMALDYTDEGKLYFCLDCNAECNVVTTHTWIGEGRIMKNIVGFCICGGYLETIDEVTGHYSCDTCSYEIQYGEVLQQSEYIEEEE